MRGSRKVYEFTPEQMQNISAIVWLYRGQYERFQKLIESYREKCREQRRSIQVALPPLCLAFEELGSAIKGCNTPLSLDFQQIIATAHEQVPALNKQITSGNYGKDAVLTELAATCKTLLHLAQQIRRFSAPLVTASLTSAPDKEAKKFLKRREQECEDAWQLASDAAHANIYFTRQIEWLTHRFPKRKFEDVLGLCKIVTRADIKAADWSLTPGRYVGVAPQIEDEDFDFEQTMRDIHTELAELNKESVKLAKSIQQNFEELAL